MTWSQHNAQDSYQGTLPGCTGPDGTPLHGWALWSLFGDYSIGSVDTRVAWTDPKNQQYYRCVVPTFINPGLRSARVRDAAGYGLNHYSANSRAMANGNFRPFKQFTD